MMEGYEDSSDKHRKPKKIKTTALFKTLNGEIPNLPQDIIAEILVRLPVKPLLKFRCVSKSWFSLISSPKFIKTHLAYSTLDPTFSNYRLMLRFGNNLKHSSASCVFRDLLTDVADVDFPNVRTDGSFKMSGSCNGLLCIAVNAGYLRPDDVFLWNPSLRMSKKLPFVPAAELEKFSTSTYGIGYDETNDDYKVLRLFWYYGISGDIFLSMVYSLKNDSWKNLEDFKGGRVSKSYVIYALGHLLFLADFERDDLTTGCNIVSLDLVTEVYELVEHPGVEQPKYDDNGSGLSISVLEGCISALYTYAQDYADVWVLKEYSVKESWTKLVRIPYIDGSIRGYLYQSPLCILSNGKVLLRRTSHLLVYDPEDDSFVCPQICNAGPISSMGIYVESLVRLST